MGKEWREGEKEGRAREGREMGVGDGEEEGRERGEKRVK